MERASTYALHNGEINLDQQYQRRRQTQLARTAAAAAVHARPVDGLARPADPQRLLHRRPARAGAQSLGRARLRRRFHSVGRPAGHNRDAGQRSAAAWRAAARAARLRRSGLRRPGTWRHDHLALRRRTQKLRMAGEQYVLVAAPPFPSVQQHAWLSAGAAAALQLFSAATDGNGGAATRTY